jgi:hypothetical protein
VRENEDPNASILRILKLIPPNIARFFFPDLTTKRMGPLYESVLSSEKDELLRYFVAMQIVLSKPRYWVKLLSTYIASLDRRSFYLFSLNQQIETDYAIGFNSNQSKTGLRDLLVKVIAKHQLKIVNPNRKTTEKIEKAIADKLDKLSASSEEPS